MIVRRILNALKRQDWTAVSIEFTLVVVGVLLAFQISEWATERQLGEERQAATERLLFEAGDDVAYFRSEVEVHHDMLRDLSYTLEQIQEGTWREANRAQMQSALTASVYLDVPSPPSSVYEDIVAAGMLGKIGDPRLRAAISDYRAQLNLLSRLIDYVREIAPKLDREDSLHYVYDAAGPRTARLDVNFAALAADTKLLSSFALLDDRQAFILKSWQQTLAASETMCRELARTLHRKCNLNRPAPTNK